MFNDGTFKQLHSSELIFKLKNNIGELRKYEKNDGIYSKMYSVLYYIYPNEINSDVIQETVIASYKGLTCEFCDIYVYKNRIYVIGEWTGNSFLPDSYLVWNNRQYDVTHIKISFGEDGYGELQEHTENENVSLLSYFKWKYEHNNIILDFYEDKRTYEITDVIIINNYMFTGSINNVQFSLIKYGYENINKNPSVENLELHRLEFPHISSRDENIIIIHKTDDTYVEDGINYSLEWDCQKKAPHWVCYQLNKNQPIHINRSETNVSWCEDPNIPINARFEDTSLIYKDSGFVRGHLCASADRLYSIEANEQVFYYSNALPMFNNFDSGIWNEMENCVHRLTRNCDILYVCKGGTINDVHINGRADSGILTYIGDGGLIVPKYFFMALLIQTNQSYKGFGFFVEHTNEIIENLDLKNYVVSLDELEMITGIDFFCNLSDDVENQIEQISKEQLISELNI